MTTPALSSLRPALGRTMLLAFGCALGLVIMPVAALNAAESASLQPLAADKAPALPLSSAFAKGTGTENGPYVLTLTNTSKETLAVTVKVLLSVAFHADNKARNLPEHAIEAGQTWTVPDLAAADKVIVTAKGYAPLELTVP
jgi:hypothetical protein